MAESNEQRAARLHKRHGRILARMERLTFLIDRAEGLGIDTAKFVEEMETRQAQRLLLERGKDA